jgi:hypothetical protein
MPKATCPSCKTEVKYAKGTKPGSAVTCPECEEVFTPPKLKKKDYDPATEDTYEVKRSKPNAADADKARHAAEAVKGAMKRQRELDEMSRGARRKGGWFDGPEVWLIPIGLCTVVAFALIVWLARR